MIYDYIQYNFVGVINILFLLVFIGTNHVFDKRITRRFMISIFLLIVVTVAENIEYYMSVLTYPNPVRIWASTVGYILRPMIIYHLLLIVRYRSKRERILVAMPAVINTVIYLVSLFNQMAFTYDAANEFVRGPFGYTAHVCSAIYMILILIFSISFFREKDYAEGFIIVAIVVICTFATVLESVWKHEGLLRVASSLSITFFYLYFCTQSFKRDALTGALNRHSFYADADKYSEKIAALIAVDLNDLKQINDSCGHAAGDEAICTTVNSIYEHLLKGCTLYRTGGDEFMIICLRGHGERDFDAMIDAIDATMKETPYRCAFGIAERQPGETFRLLCARADAELYENKIRMKENLQE